MFLISIVSANLYISDFGSEPVERTNINGVVIVASRKQFYKSKVGGIINFSLYIINKKYLPHCITNKIRNCGNNFIRSDRFNNYNFLKLLNSCIPWFYKFISLRSQTVIKVFPLISILFFFIN